MRRTLEKLRKGVSTKSERRLAELLKSLHIPFRTKVKIGGREVDFLIGKNVIEVDSHQQDVRKNYMLFREGYTPLHLNSWEIGPHLRDWLTKLHVRN
jgi:very-short-patch-repair endonuclease